MEILNRLKTFFIKWWSLTLWFFYIPATIMLCCGIIKWYVWLAVGGMTFIPRFTEKIILKLADKWKF